MFVSLNLIHVAICENLENLDVHVHVYGIICTCIYMYIVTVCCHICVSYKVFKFVNVERKGGVFGESCLRVQSADAGTYTTVHVQCLICYSLLSYFKILSKM